MDLSLSELIDRFTGLKVIVIGEAMLDSYLQGSTNRLCPEAPVPLVTLSHRQDIPGGAANTAVNVRSLGAHITFLSVVGDDLESTLLRQALEEWGISTDNILTQPGRQTLAKHRVMAGSQMLVRFDQGSTDAIAPEIEQQLIDRLTDLFPRCNAAIVSDYGYGILTTRVIQTLTELQAQYRRTLVVDAKNLAAYRQVGVTAVKPNYNQAVQLLGTHDASSSTRAEAMALYGEQLLDKTGAQIVALTLDTEGALLFERGCHPYRTYAQPTSDTWAIGAGDTFISALALTMATGAETSAAAELASTAAAIVVAQDGTAACTAEALRSRNIPRRESLFH